MTYDKHNAYGKYLDEYALPVETSKKCIRCENKLGIQNPGEECGTCVFIKFSAHKR